MGSPDSKTDRLVRPNCSLPRSDNRHRSRDAPTQIRRAKKNRTRRSARWMRRRDRQRSELIIGGSSKVGRSSPRCVIGPHMAQRCRKARGSLEGPVFKTQPPCHPPFRLGAMGSRSRPVRPGKRGKGYWIIGRARLHRSPDSLHETRGQPFEVAAVRKSVTQRDGTSCRPRARSGSLRGRLSMLASPVLGTDLGDMGHPVA